MGDMGTAILKTPMLHPTVAKPYLGEALGGAAKLSLGD